MMSSSSSSSSLSDAHPKLHQSIIGMTEDEKKLLCCNLDVKRICPNDLMVFCSCSDCDQKIKQLLDFDNGSSDHVEELNTKESTCLSLHLASHWNTWMLDSLHNKLESISEELGNSLALEKSPKLENAYKQLARRLIDTKVLDDDVFDSQSVEPNDDIRKDINSGCYWYGETEAKGEALPLLEEMRNIAANYNSINKSTVVSKDYIVQLIECLEKMPVDVLQTEVIDLVELICPVADHMKIFMEAQKYMRDTCVSMISEMNELWNFDSKEHSSNGLDRTLDSLLNKVGLFKEGWEKDHAHAFTYFDRSISKRQRTA